jgi:hypothetical protein
MRQFLRPACRGPLAPVAARAGGFTMGPRNARRRSLLALRRGAVCEKFAGILLNKVDQAKLCESRIAAGSS